MSEINPHQINIPISPHFALGFLAGLPAGIMVERRFMRIETRHGRLIPENNARLFFRTALIAATAKLTSSAFEIAARTKYHPEFTMGMAFGFGTGLFLTRILSDLSEQRRALKITQSFIAEVSDTLAKEELDNED